MENFVDITLNSKYNPLLELYQATEDFKIKTTNYCKNTFQNKNINKIVGFAYLNVTKFPKNTFITDGVFSNNFLENVHNIIFGTEVIHH